MFFAVSPHLESNNTQIAVPLLYVGLMHINTSHIIQQVERSIDVSVPSFPVVVVAVALVPV